MHSTYRNWCSRSEAELRGEHDKPWRVQDDHGKPIRESMLRSCPAQFQIFSIALLQLLMLISLGSVPGSQKRLSRTPVINSSLPGGNLKR